MSGNKYTRSVNELEAQLSRKLAEVKLLQEENAALRQKDRALSTFIGGVEGGIEAREAAIQRVLQQLGSAPYDELYSTVLLRAATADPGPALAYLELDAGARAAFWCATVNQLALLLPKYDFDPGSTGGPGRGALSALVGPGGAPAASVRARVDALVDAAATRVLIAGLLDVPQAHLESLHVNLESGRAEAQPANWWQNVARVRVRAHARGDACDPKRGAARRGAGASARTRSPRPRRRAQGLSLSAEQTASLRASWRRVATQGSLLTAQHQALIARLRQLQAAQSAHFRRFEEATQQAMLPELAAASSQKAAARPRASLPGGGGDGAALSGSLQQEMAAAAAAADGGGAAAAPPLALDQLPSFTGPAAPSMLELLDSFSRHDGPLDAALLEPLPALSAGEQGSAFGGGTCGGVGGEVSSAPAQASPVLASLATPGATSPVLPALQHQPGAGSAGRPPPSLRPIEAEEPPGPRSAHEEVLLQVGCEEQRALERALDRINHAVKLQHFLQGLQFVNALSRRQLATAYVLSFPYLPDAYSPRMAAGSLLSYQSYGGEPSPADNDAASVAAAQPAHGSHGGHKDHHKGGRGRECGSAPWRRPCIPTSQDYTRLVLTAPIDVRNWPRCEGPFVLCSVANCTIIPGTGTANVPLQAACGCLSPTRDAVPLGVSLITPNVIKSASVYNATVTACFGGQDPITTANNTCVTVNSAPVCKAINEGTIYGGKWPFISTFTAYADQGVALCSAVADGSSILADCMTAACYRRRAFDGSPYTCYCPVFKLAPNTPYALGYPRSKFPNGINCTQPPAAAGMDCAATHRGRAPLLLLLLAAATAPAPGAAHRRTLFRELAQAGSEPQAASPAEVYHTYEFPAEYDLDRLPGADSLAPKTLVDTLALTLAPVTFKGPVNQPGTPLFRMTAAAYVDDLTGRAHMFAPTMRVKRGSKYVIKVTNMLVQDTQSDTEDFYHNPGNTNVHTHGIHAELGVPSQDTAGTYVLGDNPFFTIKARNSTREKGDTRIFNLKVGTAHGLIIVEDDNDFWLPPRTGCANFRAVIEAAQEVLFDMTLFFFRDADPPRATAPLPPQIPKRYTTFSRYADQVNNGPFQFYGNISDPPDRYSTGAKRPRGTAVRGRGQDVLMVNGGYQPGFMVFSFYDAATNKTTNACELQLYAKDGVYLMSLPRRVDAMFFAAANRAELLVRCRGRPGDTFVATARECQPFSDTCFGWKGDDYPVNRAQRNQLFQDKIFTIKLTARPPGVPAVLTKPLVERACTPLRPAYATDLRDEALKAARAPRAAARYDPANVYAYTVGFDNFYLPNTPEPKELFTIACTVSGSDGEPKTFSVPDSNPLPLPLGKVVQWDFHTIAFHPMHVHINPYQIQALNTTALMPDGNYTSWFEVGDYHDTLKLPMILAKYAGDPVPLRFQPGQYSGYTVMHCHFLQHEDIGCMKVVWYKCPTLAEDKQAGPCPNFTFPIPGGVRETYN
ncbi:hypothetical protein HT031_002808 [Scenedesmus sp. PABB004]|nr:hypothetical protein HT031_002808 [Scenedesmus sp. PABB004]